MCLLSIMLISMSIMPMSMCMHMSTCCGKKRLPLRVCKRACETKSALHSHMCSGRQARTLRWLARTHARTHAHASVHCGRRKSWRHRAQRRSCRSCTCTHACMHVCRHVCMYACVHAGGACQAQRTGGCSIGVHRAARAGTCLNTCRHTCSTCLSICIHTCLSTCLHTSMCPHKCLCSCLYAPSLCIKQLQATNHPCAHAYECAHACAYMLASAHAYAHVCMACMDRSARA